MKFEELVGKSLARVTGAEVGSGEVRFEMQDGSVFRLFHNQDCCESVDVAEVHGDPALMSGEIEMAIESSNSDDRPGGYVESWKWTFYRVITAKGTLVLRWLGRSNGYYSESVSFEQA
jgi:hypothetical protein